MRKLPEDERLKRGIQVLLNDHDQEDLRNMAVARGTSLSGLLRVLVQEKLDEWRETESASKSKNKTKK